MNRLPAETAHVFACEDDQLIGIINHASHESSTALLVIVGGPQYRIGSHRQFVELARYISSQGVTTMRFDYRGMGDADGDIRSFQDINEDIKCAIDELFKRCPAVRKVILWGLCDAATAASFYSIIDNRVVGLVLLNPWVRENIEQIDSTTMLKHYYFSRIISKKTWKNLISNWRSIGRKVYDLAVIINDYLKVKIFKSIRLEVNNNSLLLQLLSSLDKFSGKTLIIISGDDLTAKEFLESVKGKNLWNAILKNNDFTIETIAGADHTFSSSFLKRKVEKYTKDHVLKF